MLEALIECGWAVDLLTYPIGETIRLQALRTFRISGRHFLWNVPIGFSASKLLLDAGLASAMWRRLAIDRYSCIHAVEESAFTADSSTA